MSRPYGGGRRFDDDDDDAAPSYRGGHESSSARLGGSGVAGSGTGGQQSSRGSALSLATVEQLRQLNEQLSRELADREADVQRLESAPHKGEMQRKLQQVLQENRDLRARLEELRGVHSDSASRVNDAASLLGEVESLKNELARSKSEYEALLSNMQHEADHLRDELHVAEAKVGAFEREQTEQDEEMATLRADRAALIAERGTMAAQLATLRSGGRVAELEERLQQCTQLLQTKEAENDTLLREMAGLQRENEQLRSLQHEHIQDVQVRHVAEMERAAASLAEKQAEVASLSGELQRVRERANQLEQGKTEHDALLLELRSKMSEYERGYNIADAVAELRGAKTALKKVQLEREADISLLNQRDKQLQRYVAENRQLKRMAGVDDTPGAWGLNSDELGLQSQIELQKLQSLHRTDERIIARMEAERVELLDQLRRGATDRTQDGLVFLGLSAQQTRQVSEYAARLKEGDDTLPLSEQSYELAQKLEAAEAQLDEWKERHARALVEKDEVSARLLALMERDKGAAYEQILKQITDIKLNYNLAQLSQSTPHLSSAAAGQPQLQLQSIPESPSARSAHGLNLRSPSAFARSVPSTPGPLPPTASAELRGAVERVSSLPLQDKHAVFTRLFQEFQPSGVTMLTQPSTPLPGSRLLSPTATRQHAGQQQQSQQQVPHDITSLSASSRGGQQPQSFTFAGAVVPAGSAVSSASDAGVFAPAFDALAASNAALMSLDTRSLASMDAVSKARLSGALQELLAKESENHSLLDALELYQVRFEKLSARQQLLYIEYNNSRQAWSQQEHALKRQLHTAQEQKDTAELQLAKQGGNATNAGAHGENDSGDATELQRLRRANQILTTNERILARRFNALQVESTERTAALVASQREFVAMEGTLRLRVLELSKRKKLLESRVHSTQALLASWVPKEELFKIARKYNWISNAYAALITSQDTSLVARSEAEAMRRERDGAVAREAELATELALSREKVRGLEEALATVDACMLPNPDAYAVANKKRSLAQKLAAAQENPLSGRFSGGASLKLAASGSAKDLKQGGSDAPHSIPVLLAELADLRAREASASKRASRLDEHLASTNAHASELETELLTLRKAQHELQTAFAAEQEVVLGLRNQLEGAVSFTKANSLQASLLDAREKLEEARAMQEHLRQIADLANQQALQLLSLHPESASSPEHDGLVAQLRNTVAELESQSDDAARVGKVHRENMHLKLTIRRLEKEAAAARKEAERCATQARLSERELDLKNTDLFRLHSQARQQLAEKEQALLALTSAAAGPGSGLNHPMTLQQAETLHAATTKMSRAMEENKAENEALKTENNRLKLQAEETAIQLQAAKELAALLPAPLAGGGRASQRRGVGARGGQAADAADDNDPARPLPASLQLQGSSAATSALDPEEYALKLRQALVKHSTELSALKLQAVRSAHHQQTLESKLAFLTSEVSNYEQQLATLQAQLVEKDLYITQKEADFKEQYLYLKEQEGKLKLAESIARLDRSHKNKRQQNNAAATIRRITGQESGGTDLRQTATVAEGDEGGGDDDPFAVHDGKGRAIDVENLQIDELTRLHDDADALDGAGLVDPNGNGGGGGGARLLEGVLQQLQAKLRHAKQVLADQRERLGELEAENARFQSLKASDEAALASAGEVASMERARLLSTAQQTIASLHEQLAGKNARLEKYQSMVEEVALKAKQRKVADEAEIERLNAALLAATSSKMAQVNSALTFLDEMPRLPKDVVSRAEMESVLAEKEALVQLLHKEVDFFKHAAADEAEARSLLDQELKRLYTESRSELAALQAQLSVAQASRADEAKMAKMLDRLKAELATKEAAALKLEEAMQALKDSVLAQSSDARRAVAAGSGGEAKEDAAQLGGADSNSPDALRKQVASLERKVKSLAAQLSKERSAAAAEKSAALGASQALTDKDDLVRAAEAKAAAKAAEVDALKRDLALAQAAAAKAREAHLRHKERVAKEVGELKAAQDKERDLHERRLKLAEKGTLSAALASSRGRSAGAPTTAVATVSGGGEEKDSSASGGPSSASAALAGKAFNEWEADKRAASRVALLQKRLEKSAAEVLTLQAHVSTLTQRLSKEQKEKLDIVNKAERLEAQLRKHASKFGTTSLAALGLEAEGGDDASQPQPLSDVEVDKLLTKEALKQKLFDLQAVNDGLQRQISVDWPAQTLKLREEAAQANKRAEQCLRDKREAERALKAAQAGSGSSSQRSKSSLHSTDPYTQELAASLSAAESALSSAEGKVLELTVSNLDLKYSVSHAALKLARLQTRLAEQSNVIRLIDGNYLAKEFKELVPQEVREFMAEMDAAVGPVPSADNGSKAKPSASTSSSGAEKGSSHKSLALILSAYRKILEKLRAENEAARKTAHSNVDFVALLKENKLLKKKVAALSDAKAAAATSATAHDKPPAASAAAAPSTADESKESSGGGSLVDRAELERAYQLHSLARKELKKEQEAVARLRRKLTELARELEERDARIAALGAEAAAHSRSADTEAYRREKNLLASLDEASRARSAAEDDNKKLQRTLKEMRRQSEEMRAVIAAVRATQGATDQRVLQAAQVQAAVLSKTEAEAARERAHAAAEAQLRGELERLQGENAALKQELAGFDVNFFEELEQLKFAYSQSVEKVKELTKQLDAAKAAHT